MSENVTNDLRVWLDKEGEEALRKIGIRRGQTVLDFGCGSGNYTIPAARIVGEEGRVYALDKDERALDELMQRAETEGLRNIRRIETSGEVEIRLDTESVDAVLLYDIFWYFPLSDDRLTKLLSEVYSIATTDALISVYPKHINSEQLKDKIESAGFHLKDKYFGLLIHDGHLETGQILNFRKRNKK
jgi:ubiquinone/menaquinone biosynthesis C-methylase UbiE